MTLSPTRIRLAWLVAILADAIQIGLISFTGPFGGWLTSAPLDILAMILLWVLIGWHWALMPSFIFEFLPIVEIAPSWSLATWIALRKRNVPLPELNGLVGQSHPTKPLD